MLAPDDDILALKAALAEARQARVLAEAEAARAVAEAAKATATVSSTEAVIAHLKLMIEKLRRELYGRRSERAKLLIDQMELQLEDLEAGATEDELAAEQAAAKTTTVQAFTRKKPSRKPFPEDLPRERVVVPGPTSCACCGSDKLAKLGETVTETLEVIPRQWKVIQYIREKFTCRQCETISQPPAPFHVIRRGFAGPSLLAMILFEKYGQHQPLNRQSERYAKEGIDLSLSTLADLVGHCTFVLRPLVDLIEAHVLAGERLHGDDTPIRVLAKGQCVKATVWAYVRDDRPFGGTDPPAVMFRYSRNRKGENVARHLHGFAGILQADAYSGFSQLFDPTRTEHPMTPSLCWAHSRRKLFELADIGKQIRRKNKQQPIVISPMALEAVKRIDVLFDIERAINGRPAAERLAVRRELSAPRVAELESWMREERAKLSRHASVAGAMDYMLKRWTMFTAFLEDGRICLTNNAAERALRGVALGRRAWLFAGSDRGGDRAAVMLTLIGAAKLNDIDPQAWLADVLKRIADHPAHTLDELLPWHWTASQAKAT
jgi:transposase